MSTWSATGGSQTWVMKSGTARRADAPEGGVVQVGDGAPDVLPAPVLPDAGKRLPALSQDNPADIVSGWVRLWIAGFLQGRPNWDGVICALQGDVSHWLHISAEEVVSSQSFLTPRLIAPLGGGMEVDTEAVSDTMSRPERLAALLRVAELTGNAGAITGYLIGAELAAARPYWLGQQLGVIGGDAATAKAYAKALEAQGVPVEQAASEDVLAQGLEVMCAKLEKAS